MTPGNPTWHGLRTASPCPNPFATSHGRLHSKLLQRTKPRQIPGAGGIPPIRAKEKEPEGWTLGTDTLAAPRSWAGCTAAGWAQEPPQPRGASETCARRTACTFCSGSAHVRETCSASGGFGEQSPVLCDRSACDRSETFLNAGRDLEAFRNCDALLLLVCSPISQLSARFLALAEIPVHEFLVFH